MRNPFKKRIHVFKCNNLLYLEESPTNKGAYNIILSKEDKYSHFIEKLSYQVDKIQHEVRSTHELLWVRLYQEYRKNYSVYDRYPYLLLYKIPPHLHELFGIQYFNDDLIFNLLMPSPEIYENSIPDYLKIPPVISDMICRLFSKCIPYLGNTLTLDEYQRYLGMKYLVEWDEYFNNEKRIPLFIETCIGTIQRNAPEENKQLILNIIEREDEILRNELKQMKDENR